MPIPFILGGLALAAAVTGVKKGFDAKSKNKEAKGIVKSAQHRFKKVEENLKNEGDILNKNLEAFAEFKLLVFTTQIRNLVELMKKHKITSSSLNHENISLTPEEIKQLENTVSNSLEITSGIAKGLQSGALTAFGAYGSVGMLASASTGTAISTLGGAAATNATLAWLGGGSLAAGGGGMALGTAVLSGVAAGPLIAVAGFVMDSKAEGNLTEACEYESDLDIKIEKMKLSIEGFKATSSRINELETLITNSAARFDNVFSIIQDVSLLEKIKRALRFSKVCEHPKMNILIPLGRNLKDLLNIPLLDKEGNSNDNFKQEIKRIVIS
ncbi:MAG: hypothetical protein Q9M28_06490 [Mariprofundaceae bacterium]|nr:hypothetical protein [Mariprofundaceae bacterium]